MSGFPRFRTRRAEHERFARAVESAYRTGDARDDEFGDELALVSVLRELGTEVGPDAQARARIAQRVSAPPEPARRRSRLVPVLAAALGLVLALGGLGVLLSRDALPGDSLYGIKRAREAVLVGLTFDEGAKGRRQLEYAAGRLDELHALVDRADTGGYRVALAAFDEDAREGTRRLVGLATTSDGAQLDTVRAWAATQADQLARLRAALPPEVADSSAELVARIGERATELAGRMGCYRITSGERDELGALPAPGSCAAQPPDPGAEPPGDRGSRGSLAEPPPAPHQVPKVQLATTHEGHVDAETRPSAPTAPARPAPVVDPTPVPPAPLPGELPRPRLPAPEPPPPALLTVPPLLPVLPEVRIG